ncbi:non-ribosomal peptide synthetase [Pseudoalteromonas sp. OANN1]|uniref:non-ribosomal peptide synthetase n=1 Tax=Pseudoalteromonas sp. OANN1 TaxID=2954497 RepID=UPI00209796A2|nr:non-ribosomal peptide synthetase [Pseudoalteromonas sp. OANN1]MCO7199861.1 amino acid adenylation domain-containing protein [Pseudoalteromonas sp. OANN1]
MQDDFLADIDSDILSLLLEQDASEGISHLSGHTAPLSYLQQQLWTLQALDESNTSYLMPVVFEVHGQVDAVRLELALQAVIANHSVFRTQFIANGNEPTQVELDSAVFSLEQVHSDKCRASYLASEELNTWLMTANDLTQVPQLKAQLISCADQLQILALSYHHLVSDGWSNNLILADLKRAYQGLSLSKPALRYLDFAHWQRSELSDAHPAVGFWLHYLNAPRQSVRLHQQRVTSNKLSSAGARQQFMLNAPLSVELNDFCKRNQVTPFASLLAVWQLLLSRHHGNDQFVVGVPNAGRSQEQVQDIVGCFITTQAYRCEAHAARSFIDIVKRIQGHALTCTQYSDVPFEYVLSVLPEHRTEQYQGSFFQVGFDCQPQLQGQLNFADFSLEPVAGGSTQSKFAIALSVQTSEANIACEIEYDLAQFDLQYIQTLQREFCLLLTLALGHENETIGNWIDVAYENQRPYLPESNANKGKTLAHVEKLTHTLIRQQALATPTNTAMIFQDHHFDYQWLEAHANYIASQLQTVGVKAGEVVGIALPRSPYLVASLLACFKSGVTYLPLDAKLPEDKLTHMIEDSGCVLVLGEQLHLTSLPLIAEDALVCSDTSDWFAQDLTIDVHPEHIAYLNYTSGSTGQAKGVAVAHGALSRYIFTAADFINLSQQDVVLQFATANFDAFVEQVFPTLVVGAALVIRDDSLWDAQQLFEQALKHRISVMDLSAAYWRQVAEDWCYLMPKHNWRLPALRQVHSGGEAMSKQAISAWRQAGLADVKLVNTYGPTEIVVEAAIFDCTKLDVAHIDSVPIGTAIAERKLYVLDAEQNLVPQGQAGELYIGGDILAQGYFGRAGQTAASFVADPFSDSGKRLYRTGDLVRWNEHAQLEFIGRVDNQVKIRGFRVEIEEVELKLRAMAGVSDVAVVAQQHAGTTRLLAYLCSHRTAQDIQADARAALPEYMVPAVFTLMDSLPLNANGKVDRSALPAPKHQEQTQITVCVGEAEQSIAAIWCKLFNLEQIGRDDNFFALGGDSIICLQMVSLCRQAGWEVSPGHVFEAQTIANIAALAVQLAEPNPSDVEEVKGQAPLLPIQQAFFEQREHAPHHYNQAVMLRLEQALDWRVLQQVIGRLIQHHDALRLTFSKDSQGYWQQSFGDYHESMLAQVFTMYQVESEQITALAEEIQASLNIQDGPLMRAAVMTVADGSYRVLLVVHHLVIDGVSWRIVLDDLATGYEQLLNSADWQLPAKSSSVKKWAEALQHYGEAFADEANFWHMQTASPLPFPYQDVEASAVEARVATAEQQCSVELTTQLLTQASRPYRTQVNDLLLSALSEAVYRWLGKDEYVLHLEGHGREPWQSEIDLSRTVGWFTAMFPLKLSRHGNWLDTITGTKEALRRIPNKGIGYGALKYGNSATPTHLPEIADIEFNYLGQLDNNFTSDGIWQPAVESTGASHNGLAKVTSELAIQAQVLGGQLQIRASFVEARLSAGAVNDFMRLFQQCLEELVSHCETATAKLSRSDVPLAQLSDDTLRQLDAEKISKVYPLSAMQEGMLFHALYSDNSAYINQMQFAVTGLDIDAFSAAWQRVTDRHDALRTGLLTQVTPPHQYVVTSHQADITVLDWSMKNRNVQAELGQLAKQQVASGFNLEKDIGFNRVVIVRLNATQYRVIWTNHHLFTDGWSASRMMGELLSAYQGQALTAVTGQYDSYIAFLQAQDQVQNSRYWQQQLQLLSEPCTLFNQAEKSHVAENQAGQTSWIIDSTQTETLLSFCRHQQITVNTLIQAAWSLVLKTALGRNAVCFGSVTSGRPPQLPQSDSMLGLFINTLPTIVTLEPELPVGKWLQQLQRQSIAAREHEYTPLSDVQKWAREGGLDCPNGLFDTLVVFENYPIAEALQQADKESTQFELVASREETDYPLTVSISQQETIDIAFHYQLAALNKVEAKHLLERFVLIISQLAQGVMQPLGSITALSAEQEKALLELGDPRSRQETQKVDIIECLYQQAEMHQHSARIHFEDQSLSYQALLSHSEKIADGLQRQGIRREDRVALLMRTGLDTLASILAIWQLGAIYVPLDSDSPDSRLHDILAVSEPRLVLYQGKGLEHCAVEQISLSSIINLASHAKREVSIQHPQQLAYLVFTSGSTGKPKGVAVTRAALLSHCLAIADAYQYKAADHALAFASLGFDAGLEQVFVPLLTGAQLTMVNGKTLLPEQCSELITAKQINIVDLPRAYLQHLPHLDAVRLCIVGGEAWPVQELLQWRQRAPHTQFINAYGPTETVITPTIWQDDNTSLLDSVYVPIGSVVGERHAYVLSEELNLTPQGGIGELYIAGTLAQGYFARADLTAERFIANPFSDKGERLYRTGDLVRWGKQGELVYHGRADQQVKVRGYRIELAEIEKQITAMPSVNSALVRLQETQQGAQLVAYVIGEDLDLNALQTQAQQRLPDYMQPAHWFALAQFPLTINGKIDVKALPQPSRQASQTESHAMNTHEKQLAAIWQALLGVEASSHSQFFHAGGDSILAMRLTSQINQTFGLNLGVREIFEHSEFTALAQYIAEQHQANREAEAIVLQALPFEQQVPVSAEQRSLWITDKLSEEKDKAAYNITTSVNLFGELDVVSLQQAFTQLLAWHRTFSYRFIEQEGDVVALYSEENELNWQFVKLTDGLEQNTQEATELRQHFERTPFDLAQDVLLRVLLVEIADKHYQLTINMHHIVSDGWSMGNLVQQVGEFYLAQVEKRETVLPALQVQYSDYAKWQQLRLASDEAREVAQYWRTQLADAPMQTLIPLHSPRPENSDTKGEVIDFTIVAEVRQAIEQLAQHQQCSVFSVLLASYAAWLYEITGQQDLVLGTDLSGREHADLEPLIGYFIRVLPLRIRLTGAMGFAELCAHVQHTLLDVQSNQLFTLDGVINEVGVQRTAGLSPLFQQLFVMQNTPKPDWPIEGLNMEGLSSTDTSSKFDSAIFIDAQKSAYQGRCYYKSGLYRRDKMQVALDRWLALLGQLVQQPALSLATFRPQISKQASQNKFKSTKFAKLKK